MTQYNIYAGLNGNFGGAIYQYTDVFENIEQAEEAAYNQACEIYERCTNGVKHYEDIVKEYCSENGINDFQIIDDIYSNERESRLAYYYIPTSEDDEENLIFNSITEDDSIS